MDILKDLNLDSVNQAHLLDFYSKLDGQKQDDLVSELNKIDLEQLQQLFEKLCQKTTSKKTDNVIKPLEISGRFDDPKASKWLEIGEQILRDNQAAAFLVAGGQGSRLGYDGPKGIYNIGLPSKKSIFQIQAERIYTLQKDYNCTIPWYIMTSPLNHEATTSFFKDNQFFGLKSENIIFFMQGMIPAIDETGKILMSSPSEMALVPDGNGGCFKALDTSGALKDMKARGIKFINLYSVDNVLIKICDPLFLGFVKDQNAPSASKVVAKASADEKVGLFAQINGEPGVIEYSDISDEMRQQTNESGKLVFDGANIAVHAFTIEALEKIAKQALPYHVAHKKVEYYDIKSASIKTPEEPNAWKFEQFLFDAFPMLGRMDTFLVQRQSEFAPVKNASGVDSPETARALIGNLHRSYLAPYMDVKADKFYEIDGKLTYTGQNLSTEMVKQALADKKIVEFNN